MWEVLLDALIDSAKMLPILFLAYLLVQYFVHRNKEKSVAMVSKSKKTGPLVGSVLGLFPQCGFSAVMADFFSKKYITIGTLFAVFIATSDEAIVILLSYPSKYLQLLILIGLKFVLAVAIGYAMDAIFGKQKTVPVHDDECLASAHEHCHEHPHEHHEHNECAEHTEACHHDEVGCCCCADNIFLSALKQTMEIFLFVLVANVLIGVLLYFVDAQSLKDIFERYAILQPLFSALVGLIPNCFASVFLVQMFVDGVLSFSALLGGLCTGAGVGLLVLFKKNKNTRQNVLILLTTLLIGVCVGLVGFAFGV